MPRQNSFQKLLDFLERLERENLWYRLEYIRPETICVCIVIPGEHWEVEFFDDGHIEFERFVTTSEIGDEAALEKHIQLFIEANESNDDYSQS